MFYSSVATQVASHVPGLLYGRRTAVFVKATSYDILHFGFENIWNKIFCFPPVVKMVMTCELTMPVSFNAHDGGREKCLKCALFYTT